MEAQWGIRGKKENDRKCSEKIPNRGFEIKIIGTVLQLDSSMRPAMLTSQIEINTSLKSIKFQTTLAHDLISLTLRGFRFLNVTLSTLSKSTHLGSVELVHLSVYCAKTPSNRYTYFCAVGNSEATTNLSEITIVTNLSEAIKLFVMPVQDSHPQI